MSILTNRDIKRIIRQWLKEKPVADIAHDFLITRKRVYQLITAFKEIEEYPELKSIGRRSQPIARGIEKIILQSYRTNKLDLTHLERKIEETYGIHILHNRIYQVLLFHSLAQINMKKRKQRKWIPVRTESFHVDVARRLERIQYG